MLRAILTPLALLALMRSSALAQMNFIGPSSTAHGKRHISWWIGCSLSCLPRNENEPLGGLCAQRKPNSRR